MRAGGRPYLVEILRSTESRSPTNAKVLTWSKVAEAWVAYAANRGSENYVDGAETVQRVVRITGDSMELADVTEKDRVRFESGTLVDIVAVLPGPDPRADIVLEGVTGDGVRP